MWSNALLKAFVKAPVDQENWLICDLSVSLLSCILYHFNLSAKFLTIHLETKWVDL